MTWINPGASTITAMVGADRNPYEQVPSDPQMPDVVAPGAYRAAWSTHPMMAAFQASPATFVPGTVGTPAWGYDPSMNVAGGLMAGLAVGSVMNMAMWGGMLGFGLMSPMMMMGMGYGWPLLWW